MRIDSQPAVGHLRAAAALVAVIALVWAVLSFVPGFSDRIGAVPAGAAAVRMAETRSAILTSGAVIAAALLLALAMRQPITLGRRPTGLVAGAFPAGAIGLTSALGLSWAAGAVVPGAGPTHDAGIPVLMLGWLLVGWAAFAEELMFRGFLQPLLRRAWGTPAALALTALAFALLHYLGGWRNPVSLLNIFAASLWFGFLALRAGGVLAPTLAHIGWNGAEALLFGASPNPGVGVYGALIDVDLVGPAILGGSPDGMNASATTTLLLLALIAPLARGGRAGAGESKRAGTDE